VTFLKMLFITSITLFSCITVAGDNEANNDTNANKSRSERLQYLDNRTQKLKKEVIQLGRFLSDLAWMGPAPLPNNKHQSKKTTLSRNLTILGKTLNKLEDGLLTPPGSQLIVFLSLHTSDDFILKEVNISINGVQVKRRKYNKSEVEALHRGGTHGIYIASLQEGAHRIAANYIGGSRTKIESKNEKSFSFKIFSSEKGPARKTIELQLSSFIGEPEFSIKEWDK